MRPTSSKFLSSKRFRNTIFSSTPDETPFEPEIIQKNVSNNLTSSGSSKSVLNYIDEAGQRLKPTALKARDAANTMGPSEYKKRFLQNSKACFLLSLFIIYRAYRGFFVLLPAVFREVRRKLKLTIDNPFDESINEDLDGDFDPKTGKLRFRASFTASFLAGILTMTYVASGALKVFLKFWKTIFTKNGGVTPAFEA